MHVCIQRKLNIPYKNIKSPNIESIACKTSAFFPLVPSHCRGNPMSGQIQCKFNHTRTRFLQESSSIYFLQVVKTVLTGRIKPQVCSGAPFSHLVLFLYSPPPYNKKYKERGGGSIVSRFRVVLSSSCVSPWHLFT